MIPFCPSPIAEEAAFGCQLPPDPSPSDWLLWVKHLCDTLEQLPEKDVKTIRMACRCSLKWDNISLAKDIYARAASLEDFASKARKQLGTHWEVKTGSLFVTYTACSCPMVNQNPELTSRTWCYCTLGYNKDYFSEVFNKNISVELLKAIKLGDEICLMKITPVI